MTDHSNRISIALHPNRRQVLAGLAGMVMTGLPALAQRQTKGLLKPAMISHLGFSVSDLKASAAFYQKLFGFPPLETTTPASAKTFGFYFGDHFLSLNPIPREKAGRISHYCIGCETFNPVKDGKRLMDAGFEGVRIDTNEADRWVTLPDPDKNVIQIFDKKYTAHCPTCAGPPGGASMPPPAGALLKPRMISHIGITVADLKRAKDFYQRLFQLPPDLRTLAPPSVPAYAMDFNGQFISLTLISPDPRAPGQGVIKNKAGEITHYCIAVDNFDARRDGKRLMDAGFQGVRISTDLIDCITLPDPDGLSIQISDANYIYDCPTCKPAPA
jgi:catechol 2,3-dioxygenase-like lactoylglutathione lyase family enzyme